jgi:outer membrane lipoprotein-sorting protein
MNRMGREIATAWRFSWRLSEDRMRTSSAATLIGACLFGLAATAAFGQPIPMPAPKPKTSIAPPPAAVPESRGAQLVPAQSGGGFPFRIPGFSKPGTTTAFDASQRALIDRVNVYLMSLQTLVGDFVQIGPDGRRTDGKIYLQKPGRVKFEYNPPSPIELVSDGNSVVVRDRKLETQDLYPLSQTPLRFLLADRIDLLKETNVVSVSVDDTFVSLLIEEKQTLGGSHKVLLMFSAKDMQLKQWTITDPQGFDTTVALANLDPTKKLDPAMFRIDYARKEIIQ